MLTRVRLVLTRVGLMLDSFWFVLAHVRLVLIRVDSCWLVLVLVIRIDLIQTNGVIESDVKEVIKKQLGNAAKRKDDEKTQMMQIIGLIQPMLT